VTVVDESADLAEAAHKIMLSKTFDNATSCSSENSAVIQAGIYPQFLVAMPAKPRGAICAPGGESEPAPDDVAGWGPPQPGDCRASQPRRLPAGWDRCAGGHPLPDGAGEAIGAQDPFSGEKLSPVLTLWQYQEFPEAIEYVQQITGYSGRGHSCGIHSTDPEHILALADAGAGQPDDGAPAAVLCQQWRLRQWNALLADLGVWHLGREYCQ
jgi:sulfoacetaldehyde dehydrogenase